MKLIQYSSNEGDLVCDFFLGSFSTAKVAIGLNRRAVGFELSKKAFEFQLRQVAELVPGYLLERLRVPVVEGRPNRGKPWSDEDRIRVWRRYCELLSERKTKAAAIALLVAEFGRGRFSLLKVIEHKEQETGSCQLWKAKQL